ncbi:hypothetical protein EU537_09705 [Candidatus Thorarchaeota archaeon]|nr:MAG: hypothetical protein EU537_09705 [Candidatus Thorarchaeota archaeon]
MSGDGNKQKEVIKLADVGRGDAGFSAHFEVLEKGTVRIIESKKWNTRYRLAEILVGDETAIMNIILWNTDIDTIEVGKSYLIQDAYVSVKDECIKLCKSKKGKIRPLSTRIEKINQQLNMSLPFVGARVRQTTRKDDVRTLDGIPASNFKKYCGPKDF